jgi:glutathione synthase/RimK-type ligase-like ATP-grasp enzyme
MIHTENQLPNHEDPGHFYIEYINKDSEWRIHIFDKEILRRQIRVPNTENHDKIRWNTRYGWGMKLRELAPTGVIQAAKEAIKRLKLDFGAADIMHKNGQAYVCEVNTAVGLNDNGIKQYTQKILDKIYQT